MKKVSEPIVLQSSGPIDDCGRRWNKVYIVCVVIGAITGLVAAGFDGMVCFALFGLIVGWIIKSNICYSKRESFRTMSFYIQNQVAYPELTTKLVNALVPLGMSVENDKDGSICIRHNKLIYDIKYDSKVSFCIWWRLNVARALLEFDYISNYRYISQDMGIIAWNIQQICNNCDERADTDETT